MQQYRNKARERLLSQQGIYHRGKRYIEPEAVFAQIKHNSQFNRFKLKGLEKVNVEFTLVAITHNLRKLARKVRKFAFYCVLTKITVILQKIDIKKQKGYKIQRRQIAA